jgi:beta-glucosidase
MPGGDGLMGSALVQAVQSGALPEARVNDMATRILAPYFLLGQDQGYPSFNLDRDSMEDHYKISREVGAAGIILLKNTNNVLPFKAGTDNYFSVYGAPAGQFYVGLDPFVSGSAEGYDGALYQGGGAGFVTPTYGVDPLSALLAKARESHLQIQYVTSQYDYNSIVNSFSNRGFGGGKCLVFLNSWATEGRDRYNLNAFHDGDKLVLIVAGHCASTIVIVNSVAQLNLDAWIDHPNVAAVIWSGLPGQEYGNALVDVLFGNYNPGGKLVFTLAKNDSDYGTNITETYTSNYTEGVFLDYRHFDQNNITPRFHFGYGLSYTTFSLSRLDIVKLGEGKRPPTYRKRPTPSYTATGALKLYEPAYAVSFTVTNTGPVDGSEVPQLYLGFPAEAAEPPKVLRGFERVYLVAGESKQVTLVLTQKDISYWNVVKQNWTVASGNYTVWIGTSANNDDLKLQSYFIVQ